MNYASFRPSIFNKYAIIFNLSQQHKHNFMTTNTAPNLQNTILTFNVFFREDTTTQSFLPSIISKSTEHWALFRNVFSEQKDCKLTIVDKSIETPFHCLLVTLFCKQLEEELQVGMEKITLILSPLHKEHAPRNEHAGKDVTANMPFETTDHRNDFLQVASPRSRAEKLR